MGKQSPEQHCELSVQGAPLPPHVDEGSWHVLRKTELRHSSPVQHPYPSPQLDPSPWQ